MKSPFKVPPFDRKPPVDPVHYYWWSWHPNYPRWSQSCWGGKTKAEALKALKKPTASSLSVYHNKLIRHGDGKYTEVADVPCKEMDVWERIYAQRKANS